MTCKSALTTTFPRKETTVSTTSFSRQTLERFCWLYIWAFVLFLNSGLETTHLTLTSIFSPSQLHTPGIFAPSFLPWTLCHCFFFLPSYPHTHTYIRTGFIIKQCCRTVSRNTNWKKKMSPPLLHTHTLSLSLPLHTDRHALWLTYIKVCTPKHTLHRLHREMTVYSGTQALTWRNQHTTTFLC